MWHPQEMGDLRCVRTQSAKEQFNPCVLNIRKILPQRLQLIEAFLKGVVTIFVNANRCAQHLNLAVGVENLAGVQNPSCNPSLFLMFVEADNGRSVPNQANSRLYFSPSAP